MGLDCDYCGEELTIREEIERLHRADRELIISLSHNYRELADCYKSMQASICVIRDIYSEMSVKMKKMIGPG